MHYTASCKTQSSAPEDGRDHRPKHVELIRIISKRLLLHIVGVYIIYINDARSNKYQKHSFNLKVHLKIVITEMYPRIPWELVADPSGPSQITLLYFVLFSP